MTKSLSKNGPFLAVASCVVLCHGVLLLWMILTHSQVKKLPPPLQKRLVVQAVQLQPKKPESSSTVIASLEPISRPQQKEMETEPAVSLEQRKEDQNNKEKKNDFAEIKTPSPEVKVEKKIPPAETKAEKKAPPAEVKVEKKVVAAKKIETPKKIEPVKKVVSPPVPAKSPSIEKKKVDAAKAAPKKDPVSPKSASAAKPKEAKASQAVTPKEKPKPVEIDKVALERQKQRESEQRAAQIKQEKLLSQARETIAKIDKNRNAANSGNLSGKTLAESPKLISSLQIDGITDSGSKHSLSSREITYRDELAARLKLLLKLPDYGEVKIKLILGSSGKVNQVVIISAASPANRKYIENALHKLSFPAFGDNFDKASQYTFLITLCNDL